VFSSTHSIVNFKDDSGCAILQRLRTPDLKFLFCEILLDRARTLICNFYLPLYKQEGGKIQWDYTIFSVPIYLYTKDKQEFLEYLCLIFLGINMLSELYGQ
jgi:hypothetical protein